MSRFYGTLDPCNSRKPATKTGHRQLRGHVRGWNVGVVLQAKPNEEDPKQDCVEIWTTGGSNSSGVREYLGKVKQVGDEVRFIPRVPLQSEES